ncbi:MAG: NAD(P)H-dependent oxidoreductase [Clostridia bacterium]|nr:NAD(P)H-dependent oxidoreductase [Clostridia bacterium]
MKKILYITANTKPETISSSRTVGRMMVNALQQHLPDAQIEELDLYTASLPPLKHHYFNGRNTLIGADAVVSLPPEEQGHLAQIARLCDQFIAADAYVLAAPMWSLSFPAVVKEYLDCIIIGGKTIGFQKEKPYGLLDDRNRSFVYVQSSGAALPWMLRPVLNKGMSYFEDIMKFIGIDDFYPLLVDGTGTTEEERLCAIRKAEEKIPLLTDHICQNLLC